MHRLFINIMAGGLLLLIQWLFLISILPILVFLRCLDFFGVYRLPAPANPELQPMNFLVLINTKINGYFLPEGESQQLSQCVQANFGNLPGLSLMIADALVEQALDSTVDSAVERLFFKIFYNYPGPDKYRYHAAIAIPASVSLPAAFVNQLQAMQYDLQIFQTLAHVNTHLQSGAQPLISTLCIGTSSLWSRPAAQRLFDLEIHGLLKKFNRMQGRITYWVKGKINEGIAPLWFSSECHGTISDMQFSAWRKRQTFSDLIWLSFSGLTTNLYAGLVKNDVLGRDAATWQECRQYFGTALGTVLFGYKKLFSHYNGGGNQAVLLRIVQFQ